MTTLNNDGTVNVSPMGPLVADEVDLGAPLSEIILRPFQTSTTYANLKRTGKGVFHVTDDVAMIANAAIGKLDPPPKVMAVQECEVPVLCSACRWYAVRVASLDDSQDRTRIVARVFAHGKLRDFLGLNRGKHAVVEAAILATRLHLTGAEFVLREYEKLHVLVEKTGGQAEHAAFAALRFHVRSKHEGES